MNDEKGSGGFFNRAKEKLSSLIEGTFPDDYADEYPEDGLDLDYPQPELLHEHDNRIKKEKTKSKKPLRGEDNVLDFPNKHADNSTFEIKALHITDINQIRDTIAILKSGIPCIVNIAEELDKDDLTDGVFPHTTESQRVIDLLSGASLALDGYIEEFVPGKRIYIVAPANIKISRELREVIKSHGFFGKSGGGRSRGGN